MTVQENQPFFSAWRDRLQALKNVPPVLRIVWDSGPHIVSLGLFFRVIASLIPVSTAYVSKLIIDTITAIIQHKTTFAASATHLWWLAGLEFALAVTGNIAGRLIDYYDSVLADRYTRHVSIEVMRHASQLDLQAYEDPVYLRPSGACTSAGH